MKYKDHYDVVIMGSGLAGLVSAIILAKEGKTVCVLEKNNQYGGNLQTFVRDRTIFDTGVHYIGGLSEGQNLHRYFSYIGIMEDLCFHRMDEDGFDIISFDDDPKTYRHAQGYENFVKQLAVDFPSEEENIRAYCKKLQDTCNKFPLYVLEKGPSHYADPDILKLSAKDCINSFTKNEKLRAILAGTNYLYAGEADRTPFYVHALSTNSYIQSSYRCIKGGSQITKVLIRRLKELGGDTYNHHEVNRFHFENGKIASAITTKGIEIHGDLFISNFEPKRTLELIGEDKFRKSYVNRIRKIESTIAPFTLYIVLKPETFKYQNRNFYHFKDHKRVWDTLDYEESNWPEAYMMSMGIKNEESVYGDSIAVMTYMKYDEVLPWEETFNTVAKENDRGQTYEQFKTEKAELLIAELEKKFPNIRDCIQAYYTSTPLSYRDYIGCNRGSMYGYVKDVNKPLHSYLAPKTRVKNLYLTGQSINMHGILGVTISAVVTCAEILGKDYLLDKIIMHQKEQVN
ncbi:phytoene desaturase family protein [Hyunsoonleella aquatilis]|nr:NAD(P)/FAD-dependent oxidoreductase [Hyunsoonleella aquatilis]